MEMIGGQQKIELDSFIDLMNVLEPVSYLEIGSRDGVATRYFVENVPSIREVTCVDMPNGPGGTAGSTFHLRDNLNRLQLDKRLIYFGDSHNPEIFDGVRECLYDLVFIDGDHSYEGVKQDVEWYSPLAEQAYALHDIYARPAGRAYGVRKYWEETKGGQRVSIRGPKSNRGIGIVYV